MGRPPIGKVAMTGAERTRLYREKLAASGIVTKPAGPVTKPDDGDPVERALQLVRQLPKEQRYRVLAVVSKDRIRDLEAELAQAKQQIAALQKHRVPAEITKVVQELEQAKAHNAELVEAWQAERDETMKKLEKAADYFRKTSAALRKLEAEFAREFKRGEAAKAEIAALKDELARLRTGKPVTKPVNPDSDLARAKATIVDLRRALKYFQKRKDGKIDERSYTVIRSRMHPDRVSDPEKKVRYKVAFEVFGELAKAVIDKDQLHLAHERWDAVRKKPEAKKKRPPAASRSLPRA